MDMLTIQNEQGTTIDGSHSELNDRWFLNLL
jgi:hypothetical protein